MSLVVEVFAAYAWVRRRFSDAELPSLVATLRAGNEGSDPAEIDTALQHDLSLRLGFIVHALLGRVRCDGPCLVRSLVLTKLLARRQIPARLVLGVRSEPSFAAHAWVEHQGEPVLPTEGAYRRLVEL